jgi:glycosyltransferase involved in cell wall biosynthesis
LTEISVTVPVYNIEKYLARCLDTILDQTFDKDYEIICVDDGSTDSSGKILDEYGRKYSKIKVIHQENQGLSGARNTALQYVSGKYTMFVDSDDFIAKNALEGLYNFAELKQSDVVIFDYVHGDSTGQKKDTLYFKDIVQKYGDKPFNIDTAELFVYRYVPTATWCKFYLTDLVKDIKFIEGLNNQDRPHWAEVYTRAKRVTYLPVPYYYYVMDRRDAITAISDKKAFDVFRAFSETEKILKRTGYFDKFRIIFYAHYANCLINTLHKINPNIREEFVDLVKSCHLDIDLNEFFNSDSYNFEKDNMRIIKFIKENDFAAIYAMLKQRNLWQ